MSSIRRRSRGAVAPLLLLLLLLVAPALLFPSLGAAAEPGREVRAVWITTLLGLDWPKPGSAAEQRASLRAIVGELSATGYNTIFFQVRGRGDAMYRSRFEPWSPQLTGTLGRDPGWDPLAVLLEEAHAAGMEVHAWFNTVKVGAVSAGRPSEGNALVIDRHPEWARSVEGEWWLDPGIPEVRDYIVQVGLDIARNYDIDGLQLDFIRYPAGSFDDEATYRRSARATAKDDWRRGNITKIVEAFHAALPPGMKLGAAPLGVYRNAGQTRGLQAYDETYQASREWLDRGIVDYLAPQVYWSLGDRPGNPDFGRVALDWTTHAAGRHVILGIAPYKPEVLSQLGEIIDVARAAGAAGHAFFRYSNVQSSRVVASRYARPVLPPPMAWKGTGTPGAPRSVTIEPSGADGVRLGWGAAPAGVVRVAVYRSATPGGAPGELVAVRPVGAGSYIDAAGKGYGYAVSFLDRGWNESAPTPARAPEIAPVAATDPGTLRLGTLVRASASDLVFVPYELLSSSPVAIRLEDDQQRTVASVADDVQDAGRYVAAAPVAKLPAGRYTVVITAGKARTERALVLP